MDRENIVGEKVKGFKFKANTNGLPYFPGMEEYEGMEGTVSSHERNRDTYKVTFKIKGNIVACRYPAEEVINQINSRNNE